MGRPWGVVRWCIVLRRERAVPARTADITWCPARTCSRGEKLCRAGCRVSWCVAELGVVWCVNSALGTPVHTAWWAARVRVEGTSTCEVQVRG